MNKKIIFFLVSVVIYCAACAKNEPTKLILHMQQALAQSNIVLSTNHIKESIILDENKDGYITLSLVKPTYAILQVGLAKNRLYLEPGKDLELTMIPEEDGGFNIQKCNYVFKGKNAKINKYLNSSEVKLMTNADFLLDEDAYLKKLADLNKENEKMIRDHKLPKEFEKTELLRVKYLLYEPLTRYPMQHFWKDGSKFSGLEQYEETPKVNAFIPTLYIDNDEAWELLSYRNYLSAAVALLSLQDGFMSADRQKDVVDRIKYLTTHFKSPKILEDIIHTVTVRYVEATEGKPLGEIENYYNQFVQNEAYKKTLADTKAMWAKLSTGSEVQSGDHKYQDINGKMVSLDDLKGKYIYIDVWATWCGPCCAEIPHLKTLEEEFKGKNIHFVSISVDSNKAAWVKKVKNNQMTGIQLHGGPEAQIMKDYKITGIPRFILLDREGKVIDNMMSRPSEPATVKTLKALEGI